MSALVQSFAPRFRSMRHEDVEAVARIERDTYDFPWSPAIFNDCLRVGYHCRVLVNDQTVGGYCIMSIAAGECHVLNVCLGERCRGLGLGRALVYHLIDLAEKARAQRMYLEVRPSNEVAIRLYRSIGFAQIGTRKGYYRTRRELEFGREDAVVMALPLDAPRPL